MSTTPLAGVHAELEPLQLPAIQSGWAASWVGVGDPRTVSGVSSRAIRVGLIAHSETEISLVYQVHRSGLPVREREVYRYVKPSQTHSVTVVATKRHANLWMIRVDGRRIGHKIRMQPGTSWRAFTTVESAVVDSGECNTLAYEVTEASKAKRRWTRHGMTRDWSALTREFETSGQLELQTSTEGFVVSTSDAAAPDPSALKLTWAPPQLTLPTTISVGPEGGQFNLAPGKDYVIEVGDVSGIGGVRLVGGRNVVVIGGHITIPWAGDNATIGDRLGLYLKNQTGTVHIEGLLIDNAGGDLSEGIQINAPEAVVQIQNVRIDGIHARDEVNFSDNHPDLIQPWGGVKALRVDHLSGTTDCQGFFLVGNYGPIGRADLRNIDITGTNTSQYLFWQAQNIPVNIENMWLTVAPGRKLAWSVWPDKNHPLPTQAILNDDGSVGWTPETNITGLVFPGSPPGGNFVPAGSVGVGYVSPGYN